MDDQLPKRLESTSKYIETGFYTEFNVDYLLQLALLYFFNSARSPVFTHLSSSLVGLTTLRAHKCEEIFQRAFDDCQNIHSSAWYAFLSTSRWFGFYLDWVAVIYVTCVTYISVVLKGSKYMRIS